MDCHPLSLQTGQNEVMCVKQTRETLDIFTEKDTAAVNLKYWNIPNKYKKNKNKCYMWRL
jgi:hypothetical protein